ncbi:MAG: hypothetical protein ACRD9R_18025 [Pyrinomonadaceae bacterium]
MTNNCTRASNRAVIASLLVLAVVCSQAAAALPEEKLRPEDVIAKHLEAVGAEATRQTVKTRIIQGAVNVTFRSPAIGQAAGRVVMASEGNKHLVGMAFDNTGYPQERFAFDGNDMTAGYIRPGLRSNLSEFLLTHTAIMKQGLLGGVLSEAWPLFHLTEKRPKLEYGGTKKIGDKPAHELRYTPRGGSDVRISLFFDAETFQHLRTEYVRIISAQLGGNPELSARQRESRYSMVEDFSDFKKESGLTMPRTYMLKLELDTRGGTFQAQWEFKLSQFSYNQKLDPGSFNVGTE